MPEGNEKACSNIKYYRLLNHGMKWWFHIVKDEGSTKYWDKISCMYICNCEWNVSAYIVSGAYCRYWLNAQCFAVACNNINIFIYLLTFLQQASFFSNFDEENKWVLVRYTSRKIILSPIEIGFIETDTRCQIQRDLCVLNFLNLINIGILINFC